MLIKVDKISFNRENFNSIYVKFMPNFGHNLFLFEFLKNWFQEKYNFSIITSGTTSAPKQIFLKKSSLSASATQTIEFLNLNNENIYCCIPVNKIGGLMMIIRALTGDFDITVTAPSADPMIELDAEHNFTFTSLVPYQLITILKNPESLKKINRFKTMLVGGADINNNLLKKIESLKPNVYHTFGMTETCSNFALKKLNNAKWEHFKLYNGINIKTDKNGILSVKASQTDNKWFKTNDIVQLHNDGFDFIGRNDFVINTGGFKVSPEFVENKIHNLLNYHSLNSVFVISSIDSDEWGQMIILVHNDNAIFENPTIIKLLKANLEKHEMPKQFIYLKEFPLNSSMKIDRLKLRQSLSNQ